MMANERREGGFVVSDDRGRLDFGVIHAFLSTSYWSPGIPLEVCRRAAENSLAFGVYEESSGAQVGYARVVSDKATFAYLADVFVLPEFRGRGVSKILMRGIMGHPELQGLRRWLLMTRDAHGLYEQFGWKVSASPGRVMEIVDPGVYQRHRSGSASA